MQINSYNSKQNFTGVRLSSNSMRCVKDAVNTLKKTGFDFIGKQIVFCDNTMEAKMTAGQVFVIVHHFRTKDLVRYSFLGVENVI